VLRDDDNGTRIREDKTAMLNAQRHDRRARRQAGLFLESLDDRLLLSGGTTGTMATPVVHPPPANDANRDHGISPREVARADPPAGLSLYFARPLRLLYREYEGPGGPTLVETKPPVPGLLISGSRVAVAIKVAYPPALGGFYLSDLEADGFRVSHLMKAYGVAEGTLPIANLPAVTPLVAHVWAFQGPSTLTAIQEAE
jgi:hypothetical protein